MNPDCSSSRGFLIVSAYSHLDQLDPSQERAYVERRSGKKASSRPTPLDQHRYIWPQRSFLDSRRALHARQRRQFIQPCKAQRLRGEPKSVGTHVTLFGIPSTECSATIALRIFPTVQSPAPTRRGKFRRYVCHAGWHAEHGVLGDDRAENFSNRAKPSAYEERQIPSARMSRWLAYRARSARRLSRRQFFQPCKAQRLRGEPKSVGTYVTLVGMPSTECTATIAPRNHPTVQSPAPSRRAEISRHACHVVWHAEHGVLGD